jgi:hypothetical protein
MGLHARIIFREVAAGIGTSDCMGKADCMGTSDNMGTLDSIEADVEGHQQINGSL